MNTELNSSDRAHLIRSEALRLGFSACGFASAVPVQEEVFTRWQEWIARGENADMTYMANHAEVRRNPQELLPQARTVISLAVNYYPAAPMPEGNPRIAYYAYGRDYHDVVKGMMQQLAQYIHNHIDSDAEVRLCCDTAPIFERYWAQRAGVGFVGRNSQLIIPGAGSYFFLGEIVTTLHVEPSQPIGTTCAGCRRCVEACPVGAISDDGRIDARKCISCQTIENRNDIPRQVAERMGKRVYGCDTCQEVCPHNSKARPTTVAEFAPHSELSSLTYHRLTSLTREEYNAIFRHSAVKRAKYEGLMRNVAALNSSLFEE